MCGISGFFLKPGENFDPRLIEAFSAPLRHRGPDDHGVFNDAAAGVALAHHRLSIIDLSPAGHQPMAGEDGGTVLVYNGEIYNFMELKEELLSRGHTFGSKTDSEVVLRAYLEWGEACVERFCGMFALAVWSAADRRLFLARDPMGMKPLYYAALPQGFFFASEIKAFLALPFYASRINRQSLRQYLEFGYVFHGRQTSLEGINKVLPGERLVVDRSGGLRHHTYFTPPHHQRPGDPEAIPHDLAATADRLSDLLTGVVAQHMVADVPVGLLLSGGLDSSIIAALASRHTKVTTVCMGFGESAVDEREYARVVARHIGSDHREVLINPRDIFENLEETVWVFDDLFADWGTLTTRILYRECRAQGIKVVLVGEGCDELFGGYSSLAQFGEMRGPRLWKLLKIYRWYAGRRYGGLFPEFARIWKEYLREEGGDHFYAKRLFESRNQLPNNYVMKVDKASMSVGVEARAPYLDRRVAEFAYRLSKRYLLSEETNKVILRLVAGRRGLLPPETAGRAKYGASIAASWMDESRQFRAYAKDTILEKGGWAEELGLRGAMTDYFDRGRPGYRFPRALGIFSNCAWRLLLLTLWSKKYLCSLSLEPMPGTPGISDGIQEGWGKK